ncbi:MAG: hypothetical protein U9O54_04685, partial [Chloroflexota bacterium]|nr:hypothetical protein [Chloroflexota bacterium]
PTMPPETWHVISLPIIWTLNGLLTILYVMTEYVPALLIIPALTWLTADIEDDRRPWMVAASALSLAAALFAPLVVGVWLNIMAYGSIVAIRVEKFNRSTLRWRVVSGLTAYALIGLGFLVYQALTPVITASSEIFSQGQSYLNVIISLAVWIMPLGFVGLLVQAVWVHPPQAQAPGQIIEQIRTRGRR